VGGTWQQPLEVNPWGSALGGQPLVRSALGGQPLEVSCSAAQPFVSGPKSLPKICAVSFFCNAEEAVPRYSAPLESVYTEI